MKKINGAILILLLIFSISTAIADSRGFYRSDNNVGQADFRNNTDRTFDNNWSTQGNMDQRFDDDQFRNQRDDFGNDNDW